MLVTVLGKLASAQGTRSEVPNQELARGLAERKDAAAIKELVENLSNNDKAIQSDCIKVLYEIGYVDPRLIAEHVDEFIELLGSRNNRLVWGGMIALSTVAGIAAERIFDRKESVRAAVEGGSVITIDAGIRTLSRVAASRNAYNKELFPYLLDLLRNCRPKSVAQFAESISEAVTAENKRRFLAVLDARRDALSSSQLKRVERLLRKLTAVTADTKS